MTWSHLIRDKPVMMSSTMPSAKYSCSGSPLILVNGNTDIDGLSGNGSRSFSRAPRHDRDHDVKERVVGAQPERNADQCADRPGDDRTDRERNKYLYKALDQHLPVHENTPDNNRGNEQIEKVRGFRELCNRLH